MKKLFIVSLASFLMILPFQTKAYTQQDELNAILQKLISSLMQQVAQLTLQLNEQLAEQKKITQDLQLLKNETQNLQNINYPKGYFKIEFQQDATKNFEYTYNPVQVSIIFRSNTKILTPSIDIEVVYPLGNKSNLTLKCSEQTCSNSFQFVPNNPTKQKFEVKYGDLPIYEEFTPTINPYKQINRGGTSA